MEIPWEYLHDGDNFILKQPRTNLVRVLDELPQEMAPFRPLTALLLATANPRNKPSFDGDQHVEALSEALRKQGIDVHEIRHSTRNALREAISSLAFDAFYFLGHGQLSEAGSGEILLEDAQGNADPTDAADLALWLSQRAQPVYLAYFNACHSGEAASSQTTFAGAAQRVLADGQIPAVLAQQAPVLAGEAMRVAESFFSSVRLGNSPEAAVARARSAAPDISWGFPVLYTHVRGPEEFERNRIATLLGAQIGESRYGIVMATFGMGVQLDGHGAMTAPNRGSYELPASAGPVRITVSPPETFVYPGYTHSHEDVSAMLEILSLVSRVADPEDANIYSSMDQKDVTHWFLVGSRSNRIVASVLKNYSPRFRFEYDQDQWTLVALDSNTGESAQRHSIPAPLHLGETDYRQQEDFGILEKIRDPNSDRIYVIVAGLGSRATEGCARYLARNWERLLLEFGAQEFGIALHFPPGLPSDHAQVLKPVG